MAISIVLCVCFTINSVILVEDISEYSESQQRSLIMRLATMLVMWVVWLVITFELIPWEKQSDNSVNKVEQEQNLEINLPT